MGCSCTHKILFRSTRVREFQRAMLAKTQLPTSQSPHSSAAAHIHDRSQSSLRKSRPPIYMQYRRRAGRECLRVRQELTARSWLRVRAQPCVRARRRQIRLLQLNLRLRASLGQQRSGSAKHVCREQASTRSGAKGETISIRVCACSSMSPGAPRLQARLQPPLVLPGALLSGC